MREIKFRYWGFNKKRMVYYPHFFSAKNDYSVDVNQQFKEYSEPGPVEWMQYTGLKDGNDNDIYEGDVLRGCNYTVIVEWNEGMAGFLPFCEVDLNDDHVYGHEFEVIGNIYENPELLDSKE